MFRLVLDSDSQRREVGTVKEEARNNAAAAAPGNLKHEARLVSTRHTAVADVDIGGWRIGGGGCWGTALLPHQPRTMWPRSGLLHRRAQPGSCTARPRRPDVTRVIAVTGARGREEREAGGCTGRMLRREARIGSLQTAVRMKDERG